MHRDEHQGYVNYETFTVAVVLDNTRKLHERQRAIVRAALDAGGEYPMVDAAKALQEWAEREVIPDPDEIPDKYGIGATLLRSAIEEVDWMDLAKTIAEQQLGENLEEDA